MTIAAFSGCESRSSVDRSGPDSSARRSSDESWDDESPTGKVRDVRAHPAPLSFKAPTASAERASAQAPALQAIPTPVPLQGTTMIPTHFEHPETKERGHSTFSEKTRMSPFSISASAALRQAEEYGRRGSASIAKGAWFTARKEFCEALRLIAAAGDAREGSDRRVVAFEAALTALAEAEELAARSAGGASPEALDAVLRGHRTSAFIDPSQRTSMSAAHAVYCRFAERQLHEAATGCEAGSVALHGLGKAHAAAGGAIADHRAKARCFFSAALAVAPANFLAANDLGVLLAEDGHLESARDVLHAGLRQSPQPAMWTNLAAVHDRLGQTQLAQLARQEAAALERRAAAAPGTVLPTHNVAWLDTRGFAATSRPPIDAQHAAPTNRPVAQPSQPAASPASPPMPPVVGGWAQRPRNHALAY